MLQPGVSTPNQQQRLTPENYLVAMGQLQAQTPDNVKTAERAATVRNFYEKAEKSQKRMQAVKYWQEADRLVKGMHWQDILAINQNKQKYNFVINKMYSIKEKLLSLLAEGLPEVEFLERNTNNTDIAVGIDNYFRHEWENRNWYTTLCLAIDEAIKHRVGFIKVYWDVNEDQGRGAVVLEAVSNYDLFIDERAIIKDGKLVAKSIVHRLDKSRNEIIAKWKVDPDGKFQDSMNMKKKQGGNKQRPFLDAVRDEAHQARGGSDRTSRPPGYKDMEENYVVRECHWRDDTLARMPGMNDTATQAMLYPSGRITTECNGHILWDKPNMAGFCMFIPVTVEPDIKEIYGPSIINQQSGMQMAVNKSFSQIYEHAERCANPTRRISLSAKNLNQDTDLEAPGATVVVSGDHEAGFSYAEAPPLGGEVSQSLTIALEVMEDVSGVYEVSQGEATPQARSGVAIDKLQTAARTRSNLRLSFLDQTLKEIARCISSLFLDFVSEDRQFKFLDEDSQQEMYGVFNAAALVFPSRMEKIAEIQQVMEKEVMKLHAARRQLPPDQYVQYEDYQMERLGMLKRMIDQVHNMPAHDLVSLDVRIQPGTRSMTRATRQNNALILAELDKIDDATLLKHMEFPNRHKVLKAKADENMAMAQAAQEAADAEWEREKEKMEMEHRFRMEELELQGKFGLLEEKIDSKAMVDAAKIRKPEQTKEAA